ncbi:MAG: methyltransferase [Flavobacteriaceae bacterium]
MNKPFKFKQFTLQQDRRAMKVGTDGVLLGAWTPLADRPDTILDIGAGTGLIALMLAQRSTAETIDAVEIDGAAYEQCVENFEASPWADRLFCYHASLDEFVAEMVTPYDLIVSNPPFFTEQVSSGDLSRDRARQNQSLPFEALVKGVATLLSPKGTFTVILPFGEEQGFLEIATCAGLFASRITRVKGSPKTAYKRSLIAFCRTTTDVSIDELTIETKRHEYTPAYITLTQDFYLKM